MTYVYILDNQKITRCRVLSRGKKNILVDCSCELVLNQKRMFKLEGGKVFETWREAHASMLAAAEQEIAVTRMYLERLKGRAGQIKGMKPPAEEGQS